MNDRDIKAWDHRLTDQSKKGWDNYKRVYIDLTSARDLQPFIVSGEFIFVEASSSASANAAIRLNRNTNDPLVLRTGTTIKTVFKEFYITNTAQPGEWLRLVVGINFEYYAEQFGAEAQQSEAQPAFVITNANPNTNTVGAAHVCNRVLIRARTNNAGIAYVNFGAPAVVLTSFELTAGDAISVPLSNTNRINVLFANGGDKVCVIYEV